MVTQKLNNFYSNYFLGGYISNLIDNPVKSYISISMKSFNSESSETIFIMVYRKAGYGDKKYPNPMAKIVKDAFEKHIPICCVYYNDNGKGNKMSCCYANFSVDKYAEVTNDGNLPF
jgi:hypothetical protein